MTRRKKITFAAGTAAITLLVVGLGAAGAVAASSLLSPGEESKAVIDDAAEQLGIEPEALSDALKQALKNRVDEAVEAGRLTEEQGAELKERIDSDDHPLLFGPGKAFGPGIDHNVYFTGFEAAATYLGLTEAELREALQDSTLAEIARERGKSVSGLVQAMIAEKARGIDEAVAAGRLTEEQASDIKAKLKEHVEALVNGELPGKLERRPHELWRGSFSPRAPPAFHFGGPSA
jgi:polyhydroxyalkanoate synthesis regulator phasin